MLDSFICLELNKCQPLFSLSLCVCISVFLFHHLHALRSCMNFDSSMFYGFTHFQFRCSFSSCFLSNQNKKREYYIRFYWSVFKMESNGFASNLLLFWFVCWLFLITILGVFSPFKKSEQEKEEREKNKFHIFGSSSAWI